MPFSGQAAHAIYWKVEGLGDAPWLVLLNSIGTDMDLWDAALPALRRRRSILRIDTRGHGASGIPVGDYTIQELTQDVARVMDAAGVRQATIAGVSLGGMIAMELAVSRPELASALIPICTSATMDPMAWRARIDQVRERGMSGIVDMVMGRFLSPGFVAVRPEVEATVRRALLTMSPEAYCGCAAAIRDMSLREKLREIRCPTLIMTGRRDVSTPFEGHGEHILAGIRGASHIELDAAHLAPLEAPDELAGAILSFLEN
jgi:3-oxoadipate enol-lactonase